MVERVSGVGGGDGEGGGCRGWLWRWLNVDGDSRACCAHVGGTARIGGAVLVGVGGGFAPAEGVGASGDVLRGDDGPRVAVEALEVDDAFG